ncbi:MAG: hypothetical protein JNL57_10290 [Bacteroidetes bacterium]|nr:hypothetical protein [Bacteroidota bacterium]
MSFLFTIVSLPILSNCKKIDKLTQFTLSYKERVVVPATASINLPFNLFTPDITTNSESEFEVHDTRKERVENIRLKTLNLTLIQPSNGQFSFLKSITIYISAEGLPEEKIAWKDNIPANPGKQLELETANTNLRDYIKKDKFKLRIALVTDEVLTSDQEVEVHSAFFVDARVLGQ